MFLRPGRIVGRAGPSDQSRAESDAEKRHDDHAERFAFDMGKRIEGDLPGLERGGIAAPFRNQRVGSFVTSRGEQEYHIFEESKRKLFGGQGNLSIVCSAEEGTAPWLTVPTAKQYSG